MSILTSSEVVAGNDALATDANELRDDLILTGGDFATSTGSANDYVLALDATVDAYVTGAMYKFKANFAITGSATLNVNAIGAKTIKSSTGQNLASGAIANGDLVTVQYDGTNLQLVAPQRKIVKIIQGTRAMNAATATISYAHGLGTIPSRVEIHATVSSDIAIISVAESNGFWSHGFSDGAGDDKCSFTHENNNGASGEFSSSGNDASNCVSMSATDGSGASDADQKATATFDATNIDLSWVLTGTGTANNISFTIIVHA
jgi:hypothetical protein